MGLEANGGLQNAIQARQQADWKPTRNCSKYKSNHSLRQVL